jgi:hypothetical protein
VCKYWHIQLPESLIGTDSSGEILLQPTGNSTLQKCVISIQSYVCNEMITFFPMTVPVKKYSDVDWIRQAKNTELTCSCSISCLWPLRSFLILSETSRCKRKTHWVNCCTTDYVCMCVCIYIDMVFWVDIVQTANMFSVTKAKYLKINCEFKVLFLKAGWTEFEEIGYSYFWKFENSSLALISWLNAAFGNLNAK